MKIKSKIKHAIIIIAVLFCFPDTALADPMQVAWFPLVTISFLLIFEGVIIAFLAKPSQVRYLRFVTAWFFVTYLTWAFFMVLFDEYLTPIISQTLRFSIGEAVVIVIEAGLLWVMLRLSFFALETKRPPTIIRSFFYSAVANLFSFGGSALVVYLSGS